MGNRSRVTTWVLRLVVVAYLFMLIAWPTGLIAQNTFRDGLDGMRSALGDPDVTHALWLTLRVSVIAVAINLVFGVGMSLLLVRYDFPGKRLLSALIDLPLSVSPVVVGLALVLVYNPRYGWLGEGLHDRGIDIVFATPGIVDGHLLRGPPADRARGRPGARGAGRRAGAGRPQPGRQRRPDLLARSPCRASSGPSCTASC